MANQYLVEVHEFITARMAAGQQALEAAAARRDQGRVQFWSGRLDELKQLRGFLSERFDLDTQRYY